MNIRPALIIALALVSAACQGAEDRCEDGTIAREGECVPAALGVRLTHLDVRYDLAQPVYVNNRVPISFGLTAESPDPQNPVTRNVAVSFSFVEADPADPENPAACGSSAIDVELVADGSEQLVDAFIWPTTLCDALASSGVEVNLMVDFDGGDEAAEELGSDVDAPTVVLTEARREDELNQLCRGSLEDGSNPGCVYSIDLQPTPAGAGGSLIDVRYGLSASSSVAVLPYQPTENIGPDGPADLDPTIVVQSRFVINGRDPYISAVDPALIPPSLIEAVPTIEEDLTFGYDGAALAAVSTTPGNATVSYTLRAASSDEALPLSIADPDDPENTIPEALIGEVLPGTANEVVHELFLEGETLAAVSAGGAWAAESDFVVRGCLAADFPQDGNKGDGPVDDCSELEVVLVRETPATSGASSLTFDKEFSRKLGGSRLAIESSMSTQNSLGLNGASSQVDGAVKLTGKLGKRFELALAEAHGEAVLDVNPKNSFYDAYVDAFGNRIYSASQEASSLIEQSDDFSVAKSFTLGNLGFGFGPVRIGLSIGAGGTLGFTAEDTLEAITDNAACQELLKSGDEFDICGRMTRVTSPYFGLTGSVEGGLNLRLVKAAVAADLNFITTEFPLDTTLGWGFNFDGQLVVRGDVDWDMNFTPLAGKVFIIGKVGFRRFAKTLKVNLFSFSSPTITRNLLSFSMGEFEVLQ